MYNYPSIGQVTAGQIGGHAALELVRAATNGVARVAIVRAPAVEADIVGRRHEECPQDISDGHVVNLRGHVQDAADHGHGSSEAEQPAISIIELLVGGGVYDACTYMHMRALQSMHTYVRTRSVQKFRGLYSIGYMGWQFYGANRFGFATRIPYVVNTCDFHDFPSFKSLSRGREEASAFPLLIAYT